MFESLGLLLFPYSNCKTQFYAKERNPVFSSNKPVINNKLGRLHVFDLNLTVAVLERKILELDVDLNSGLLAV